MTCARASRTSRAGARRSRERSVTSTRHRLGIAWGVTAAKQRQAAQRDRGESTDLVSTIPRSARPAEAGNPRGDREKNRQPARRPGAGGARGGRADGELREPWARSATQFRKVSESFPPRGARFGPPPAPP